MVYREGLMDAGELALLNLGQLSYTQGQGHLSIVGSTEANDGLLLDLPNVPPRC